MLRIRFLVAGAIAGLVFASPASAHPSGATAAPLAPVACTGCWVPALQSRWQYQLQGVAAYASTGGINTVISAPPAGGGAAVSPQVWDFDLYVDQAVSGNNTTLNTAGVNAVPARGGPVQLQHVPGQPCAPERAVRGAQERPWTALRSEAVLRLRHQRAVHAVQGVRLSAAGPARLDGHRQGGVRGRVQGKQPQLRQVQRLELQRHP